MKRFSLLLMTLVTAMLASVSIIADEIAPGYYLMKGSAASTNPDAYMRTTSSDLPRLVSVTMPEQLSATEKCFIWKVESLSDGTYSIQNLADKRYLGGQIGTFRHHGTMSQMPHAITFTASASGDGTFKLDADLDVESGYGTAMRPGAGGEAIYLWYCDSQQGEAAAWVFEPVDEAIVEQVAQMQLPYAGVEVEEGYYYVRSDLGNTSKPGAYLYGNEGDRYRMYQEERAELSTTELTADLSKYVFYVTRVEGGYAFRNLGTERYLGGSPNTNGHHAGSVLQAAPLTIGAGSADGSYTILDEYQPTNGFLPAYLNSGSEAFAWWAGSAAWLTSSINWNLIKLDAEAVETAMAKVVTVVGSMGGANWDAENYDYRLQHQGSGVYTGEITVTDEANGYGSFVIYTRKAEGEEANIYSGPSAGYELYEGVTDKCGLYTEGFTWKVEAGTYLVTLDLKNRTIRINDPSAPDVNQGRAYAALAAAIRKTEAEWPLIDLSALKAILADANSTDEQMEAATASIPGLVRSHILERMVLDGTAMNPFNVTQLLVNPSCDNRIGWNGTVLDYSTHMMNAQSGDFDVYQKLTGLPNGVYMVSVYNASATGHAQIYTLNSEVRNWTSCVVGTVETMDVTTVTAYVSDGTLIIGASCANGGAGDAFVADNWKLTYYGNDPDAMALISASYDDLYDGVEDLMCSAAAKENFINVIEAVNGIQDMETAPQLFSELVASREELLSSLQDYLAYQKAVDDVRAAIEQNGNLTGLAAMKLTEYLDEYVAPGEDFPNGSYPYIIANGNVDENMTEEIAYMQMLLENALRGGAVEGTVVDNLFVNLKFEEPNFTGWTEEHAGPGTCSGSHGAEVNNVAGWYDMDHVSMTQTVTGVPDGIYAVTFRGFYRTGAVSVSSSDDLISGFFQVGDKRTPLLNIWDDALSVADAEVGVNCSDDDYSNGDIRIPNMPYGAAIALNAGRYTQTVYGCAVDGQLTIGIRKDSFPSYRYDWLIVDDISVRYMGQNAEAAQSMADAQTERATTITASIYSCSNVIRNAIYDNIPMETATVEDCMAKATVLDSLCDKFMQSACLFTELENVCEDFSIALQNAYDHNRISDQVYNEYFELYTSTLAGIYAGTFTDEEVLALTDSLKKQTEALTPTLTDGYYYMVGSEVSTAPGYYLYASSSDLPHLVTHTSDNTQAIEKGFIWHVSVLEDGKISIQSITDHRYLGGQEGKFYHYGTLVGEPITITPTYYATYTNGNVSTTEVWKLNADTQYASGYGTAMRPGTAGEAVILWYCDSQQGEAPAWKFEPVDSDVAAALEAYVPEYEGDDITDGFYYVRSALTNPSKPGAYLNNISTDLYNTFQEPRTEALSTTEITENELKYLYYIQKQQDGYTFRNMETGRYLAGTMNSNGHLVGTSDRPASMTLIHNADTDTYIIEDKSQLRNNYLPAYLNSGYEDTAWWVGADGFKDNIYWNLIPVSYEDPNGVIQIPTTDANGTLSVDGIYTISGQKVNGGALQSGLYIIVVDGKARKIMVK